MGKIAPEFVCTDVKNPSPSFFLHLLNCVLYSLLVLLDCYNVRLLEILKTNELLLIFDSFLFFIFFHAAFGSIFLG